MNKYLKKSLFIFRKELYNVKQELKRSWLRKYSKLKSHTEIVKGWLQSLTFTLIINIIVYNIVWFKIIPNSADDVNLKELILLFASILLILAPFSKWIFSMKYKMRMNFYSALGMSIIMI